MSQPATNELTPKYPRQRDILLDLLKDDQEELRSPAKNTRETFKRCHRRARSMMAILDEIGDPTLENIGEDASKAVTILALHSHLELIQQILSIYEKCFKNDRSNIYYQAIPSMKDRIMILEHKKQLFGTNWATSKSGLPFLISVEDFSGMNQRRSEYGLGPARRPKNLQRGAVMYPLGKGLAQESDQRELSVEEYKQYARYLLKPLDP